MTKSQNRNNLQRIFHIQFFPPCEYFLYVKTNIFVVSVAFKSFANYSGKHSQIPKITNSETVCLLYFLYPLNGRKIFRKQCLRSRLCMFWWIKNEIIFIHRNRNGGWGRGGRSLGAFTQQVIGQCNFISLFKHWSLVRVFDLRSYSNAIHIFL